MEESRVAVHESAFITAGFRARHETLSGDPYAMLWTSERADFLVEEYLKAVSMEESVAHSLRNRFFLETMQTLIRAKRMEVLINFGAGFSMYPFLLDAAIDHIEIDVPAVTEYKRDQTKAWMEAGVLPHRNIRFHGVDFTTDYKAELRNLIREVVQDRPGFILLEGVLFFLDASTTDGLFDFFRSVQRSGDQVGVASFRPEIRKSRTYGRLLAFMQEKGVGDDDRYMTLDDEYYRQLSGYTLNEDQDYFSLSAMHSVGKDLSDDEVLNERFYILERQ